MLHKHSDVCIVGKKYLQEGELAGIPDKFHGKGYDRVFYFCRLETYVIIIHKQEKNCVTA